MGLSRRSDDAESTRMCRVVMVFALALETIPVGHPVKADSFTQYITSNSLCPSLRARKVRIAKDIGASVPGSKARCCTPSVSPKKSRGTWRTGHSPVVRRRDGSNLWKSHTGSPVIASQRLTTVSSLNTAPTGHGVD